MSGSADLALEVKSVIMSFVAGLRFGRLLEPAILAMGLCALGASATPAQTASGEPVTIGVSGPLTGQNAQYGAQWKKGFDLALEEVNAKGGVKDRPLQYVFEDSQADPRQTVAIAQKFVGDPKIVVEVGDFSSTASMAASSIYQRAGLVQFGFTNSHPNFTKGGDFIWSNSVSQADEQPRLAKYAAALGFKHLAVLYLNTDLGRASQNLFSEAAKADGMDVVASEGYQPDEKDFRSTLVRVRDGKPDAIILISYYADGALITRQIRTVGLTTPIVASGSLYLFAQVHRALRRRRQRRFQRIESFFRRLTAGGEELCREVPYQIRRGAGRFQRCRLRHDHPAGCGH
jgi:branched-chain amino acid transport system substrate-binding protein